MTNKSAQTLSQEDRERLAAAIAAKDALAAETLLAKIPQLANADLRPLEDRDQFSFGHPLYLACQLNDEDMAQLLLKSGSHPDAPGSDPDDRPVHGMPLHLAAAEHRNYKLAHTLLDFGATPNSYPNCDRSTIERMFYYAHDAGLSEDIVRRVFARFLPADGDSQPSPLLPLVGDAAPESIRLFARMTDLGAQAPLVVLVREGFHDLAMEIVTHSHNMAGTPHDHPNSTAWKNVAGAARWYGYPQLVRRLMKDANYKYSYEDAISTIGVAIGSHNRDGDYPEYREIILMQLEALKSQGDLERARQDPNFQPIYQIATDFTWHDNYGYRAAIAEPECYVDLAGLLMSWGLCDIEYRDPANGHSPLSAAVKRGHHPGIATFIRWLLENGADLRKSDPDPVNPLAIARDKELREIEMILTDAIQE